MMIIKNIKRIGELLIVFTTFIFFSCTKSQGTNYPSNNILLKENQNENFDPHSTEPSVLISKLKNILTESGNICSTEHKEIEKI